MESILSKLKSTGNPWKAAKEGTAEVAVAILASVGTNVVVFFAYRYDGWNSWSDIQAICLHNAYCQCCNQCLYLLRLTPILCAFLLKKIDEESKLHKLEVAVNKILNNQISSFMGFVTPKLSTISGCLKLIGVAFAVFILSVFLLTKVGSEFTPVMDQNLILVTYEFPTRQRLDTTIELTRQYEKRLEGVKGLKSILTTIGKVDSGIGQTSEGVYVSQTMIKLEDLSVRDYRVNDILPEIRKRLEDLPGVIVSVSIPSIMGGQELPIELDIYGEDLQELENIAKK